MNLTPAQYARLELLFSEAVDLSPPSRVDFLAGVREADSAIAGHLEALLSGQSDQTESIFKPNRKLPLADSAFYAGELILKRFRIIRELGRGGMGEVYEAQDSEMGRIALKTIRGNVNSNASLLHRFRQEVQLARMVTSPHVCRIHEFFTLPAENGRPPIAFLTMELLEGTTLAGRIASEGPLPWRDAESIALQLCQGLDAIHRARIIHRDVKSRNIMLAGNNGESRAVVMDLGLAHRLQAAELPPSGHSPLTLDGAIMGTPDYMAPEQFENGVTSPATDIYALGIVLYEMATGKLPFEASTPIAAAVRRAKHPPPVSSIQPGVPQRWDTVIDKCLDYEPERRFQSVSELAAALQKPASGALAKNRLLLGFALASLLFVASLVLGINLYRRSTSHKVPEAAQDDYREATASFNKGNYLAASRQLAEATTLDPDFVLAHARLADAFNELDSTGDAQREVNQIKEQLVTQLPDAQQTYIEAVRDTVRPDPAAAITQYQKLLSLADQRDAQATALVDLGRADERAGKISDAIQNYTKAIHIAPNSPAPRLRRGILQSRQGYQKEADADFVKADQIYATAINLEGQSEIAYQRSYVASKQVPEHEAEARKFFQVSLDAAKQIPSIALQVRALSRLSAIEYAAGHDEEAGNIATGAITLADENGVSYWATDARIRLGSSWIYRDKTMANHFLETALNEAQRNQWPRLLALSRLNLANLAQQDDKKQRQQQVVAIATPAFDYYRAFGFGQESSQCQVLLSRAKLFLGLFTESLEHAGKALESSSHLASTDLLQAQEALGNGLLSQENYPAALNHLTSALQLAEAMPAGDTRTYYASLESLLLTGTLCRLGRIPEANQAIAGIPDAAWQTDSQVKLAFVVRQAELLNTQGRYQEALQMVQKTLGQAVGQKDERWELQLAVAEALTHSGKAAKTVSICDKILLPSGAGSPRIIYQAKLTKARALLELRKWQLSIDLAAELAKYFAASGQKESELRSISILARSSQATGSQTKATQSNKKIQDILSGFEHNYGTDNYRLFLRRSEIADVMAGGIL